MYRCQLCKKVVPARTKAHRLVVETRYRRYPAREEVNRFARNGKVKYTDDPGGRGCEIVREITICPECAAQHNHPDAQVKS